MLNYGDANREDTGIAIERIFGLTTAEKRVELVERKGLGHPDSICDALHENICLELCRAYQERFGRILHHNIDKGMLVAGVTDPRPGGGNVLEPMRLVIGDRATVNYRGENIDVPAIVESATEEWLKGHLRFVRLGKNIFLQNELKQGSMQLSDIFERGITVANDTSAAVGYAPLSETEELVLSAESFLNTAEFKHRFPEAGEDVKVMAYRRDRKLTVTVALAFVDLYVADAVSYFQRKQEIQKALQDHLTSQLHSLDDISVTINTLDDPSRGNAGMYLTVLGTSAEGADCGQVGRGNRVNGLISLNRPSGNEAAAGKNPTSHVGKIYSLLAHRIANIVYRRISGVIEVYVWLCSRIGRRLDHPLIASVQFMLEKGVALEDVTAMAQRIIRQQLDGVGEFSAALARGEYPVC